MFLYCTVIFVIAFYKNEGKPGGKNPRIALFETDVLNWFLGHHRMHQAENLGTSLEPVLDIRVLVRGPVLYEAEDGASQLGIAHGPVRLQQVHQEPGGVEAALAVQVVAVLGHLDQGPDIRLGRHELHVPVGRRKGFRDTAMLGEKVLEALHVVVAGLAGAPGGAPLDARLHLDLKPRKVVGSIKVVGTQGLHQEALQQFVPCVRPGLELDVRDDEAEEGLPVLPDHLRQPAFQIGVEEHLPASLDHGRKCGGVVPCLDDLVEPQLLRLVKVTVPIRVGPKACRSRGNGCTGKKSYSKFEVVHVLQIINESASVFKTC